MDSTTCCLHEVGHIHKGVCRIFKGRVKFTAFYNHVIINKYCYVSITFTKKDIKRGVYHPFDVAFPTKSVPGSTENNRCCQPLGRYSSVQPNPVWQKTLRYSLCRYIFVRTLNLVGDLQIDVKLSRQWLHTNISWKHCNISWKKPHYLLLTPPRPTRDSQYTWTEG